MAKRDWSNSASGGDCRVTSESPRWISPKIFSAESVGCQVDEALELAAVQDSLVTFEGGVAALLARSAERASQALDSPALGRLLGEVEGLLPGNGVDVPFDDVMRMLASAQVVDVLGRPDGAPGLYAAVVQAQTGERLLAVLRDGARRDIAAEQFFTDVARAAGLEDYVAPMVTAKDGSYGLVQLLPHADMRFHDLGTAEEVERAISRGLQRDGMNPFRADEEARIDRELVASLDAITENADRHPGNALLDAETDRVTLIDHELVGGGGYYAYEGVGYPLLNRFLQGGTSGRSRMVEGEMVVPWRTKLHPDSVAHLAEVERDAIRAAHDRLAASPLPARSDEVAEWIRSPEYGDRVVDNLRRAVENCGWDFDSAQTPPPVNGPVAP